MQVIFTLRVNNILFFDVINVRNRYYSFVARLLRSRGILPKLQYYIHGNSGMDDTTDEHYNIPLHKKQPLHKNSHLYSCPHPSSFILHPSSFILHPHTPKTLVTKSTPPQLRKLPTRTAIIISSLTRSEPFKVPINCGSRETYAEAA